MPAHRTCLALVALFTVLGLAACGQPTPAATPSPMVLPTQPITPAPTMALAALPSAGTLPAYPAPTEITAASPAASPYPGPAAKTAAVTEAPSPTATPLPAPTPLPLPTGVPHRSNIGPYLLANPEAGQPTHNLLKEGAMRAFMAVNPFHWTPLDMLPHMEGYGRHWLPEEEERAYIARREQGARDYYQRFAQEYRHPPVPIHAWMSTWAFTFGDRAFAEDWVAFQGEWLRLMHENGYKAGIGGMKAYRFQPGEIAWLAGAIAQADYLFLAESGAPRLMSAESIGVTTLVYRERMAELARVVDPLPPLILDVCVDGQALEDLGLGGSQGRRGYRDWGISVEDYLADVRAYDIATLYDPYVKHVFWFATNITQDTLSFDVNTPMLAVAESWHRE